MVKKETFYSIKGFSFLDREYGPKPIVCQDNTYTICGVRGYLLFINLKYAFKQIVHRRYSDYLLTTIPYYDTNIF